MATNIFRLTKNSHHEAAQKLVLLSATTSWRSSGKACPVCFNSTFRYRLCVVKRTEDKDFGVTLGDVLVFLTGSDVIPPGAFGRPITVLFGESTAEGDSASVPEDKRMYRLPCASTCSLNITLFSPPPGVHFKEEIFTRTLHTAVMGSKDSYGYS